MKFIGIILFSSLLSLSSCKNEITPEELTHEVFLAFQNNDVDAALKYIMYAEDYELFFFSSTLDENEKEKAIAQHTKTEYIEERIDRFKIRFKEIIQVGTAYGIDWKKTQIQEIKEPDFKMFEGVQCDEIYIVFSYESKFYELTLDDCCLCERGWLMSDEPRFEPLEE